MTVAATVGRQLIDFKQVLTEIIPSVRWEVERLLERGNKGLIYGPSGSLKSWLLLDLGLHLASGKPWLGSFPIPEPRKVLYVDEEMGRYQMQRRLKRLAAGAGIGDDTLPFRFASYTDLKFHSPHDALALMGSLKEADFEPDVFIFETLRRVSAADENVAKEVAAFWQALSPLTKAGKTVIVSHHMKKPSVHGPGDPRYSASGSTDLIGGVDAALAVTRKGIGDPQLTIQPVKLRAAEEYPAFIVKFSGQGEEGPVKLIFEGPVLGAPEGATKQAQAEGEILKYLATQPEGATVKSGELDTHLVGCGVAQKTAERARKALEESGQVSKPERGCYRLPEKEVPSSATLI